MLSMILFLLKSLIDTHFETQIDQGKLAAKLAQPQHFPPTCHYWGNPLFLGLLVLSDGLD